MELHPLFSVPLTPYRVARKSIPGDLGNRVGDTLDSVPTDYRVQSHTHTLQTI